MSNIKRYLEDIKSAIFGKDVRQSIHDAIEQCYNDAISNGHTDMEVVNARGVYNNLNDRLEADKISLNNKDEYLQGQIKTLASGSPKRKLCNCV